MNEKGGPSTGFNWAAFFAIMVKKGQTQRLPPGIPEKGMKTGENQPKSSEKDFVPGRVVGYNEIERSE